jgi:hypothetical protein
VTTEFRAWRESIASSGALGVAGRAGDTRIIAMAASRNNLVSIFVHIGLSSRIL